jgi:hypothetical protein
MTFPEPIPNTKREVEQYKQRRLQALQGITLKDLLTGRFFLSGELTTIHDLVYHRLDEYFLDITAAMLDELFVKLPETEQIGHLLGDPAFDAEWDNQLNKLVAEFAKTFTVSGKINWRKLSTVSIL